MNTNKKIKTDVCIVGAGPAGMLLSKLLIDQGIKVILIDKESDFEKEFRGEFIQPGVVNILKGLKIYERLERVSIPIDSYRIMDHGEKVLEYKFQDEKGICIRQSKILPLMLEQCNENGNFDFYPNHRLETLKFEAGTVKGITTKGDAENLDIDAKLVVGADGRTSGVNRLLGVQSNQAKFTMDVLWIKVDRPKNWENNIELRIHDEGYLVLLPSYPNKIQLGIDMEKGGAEKLREKYNDISELVEMLQKVIPEMKDELKDAISSWKDFTPLSVSGSFSEEWTNDGVILIGDAAHTVGPIAGQGINQAMTDAIELSNMILENGLEKMILNSHLSKLQDKRYPEVAALHTLQLTQEKLLSMKGEEGILARSKMYSKLMKNEQMKNNLQKKITAASLTLKE